MEIARKIGAEEQLRNDPDKRSVAFLHRKEFDLLSPSPRITMRAIELSQLAEAADFASAHLPDLDLGNFARIRSVVEHDPTQVQLFYQSNRLVGLYAMLFLCKSGREALLNGQFDGARPELNLLADPVDRPAAIYTWFVACPGRPVAGFGNVSEFLRLERFARADLFARPASPAGYRLMVGIGYRPLYREPNGLHRYTRLANRLNVQEEAA